MAANTHPDYSKRRAWTLFGVWIFFALHMIHWRLNKTTLAPLELNEVLYTIHQGIVTAGFLLMVVIMISTLIFGRFFCGWACHILSLEDGSAWILKKLKIRSRPIRSRTMIWVPMGAMLYLFVWPQIDMMINGVQTEAFHVVENTNGKWSSFVTNDFWRNLPPVEIALSTFFIVGFLMIYLLGSRSFCFYGCPYGALFSIADQVAPGRIVETGTCVQCGVCTANCSSDILIHREIKEYGMVTNSKCLKDLDCVASCPENALSFAFTKPPLFQNKLPDYGNRYSFTVVEDVLMTLVFVASILIFRGLYGIIPFLMSVGMSVALAYSAVLLLRIFTKSSANINGMPLKISKQIKTPGYIFIGAMVVVLALSVHSAFVQYHTQVGQHWYEKLSSNLDEEEAITPDKEMATKALNHFEQVAAIGLIEPDFLKMQMASLYLVFDRTEDARNQLERLTEDPRANLKAHYRLAILESKENNLEAASTHFNQVIEAEPTDPEEYFMKSASLVRMAELAQNKNDEKRAVTLLIAATEAYNQNMEAWVALASHYVRTNDSERAIKSLEKVLALDAESALAHNNLAAVYARSGNTKEALKHFEILVQLQPTNHQAYYNLGMMQMKLGQADAARKSLSKALQINPNYALAANALEKLSPQQTENTP